MKNYALILLYIFAVIQISASAKDSDGVDTELLHLAMKAATSFGDVPEMQRLLRSSCVPINQRSGNGITFLHWAAVFGQDKSVEFLLNNGANPFLKTSDGATPLDFVRNRESDIKNNSSSDDFFSILHPDIFFSILHLESAIAILEGSQKLHAERVFKKRLSANLLCKAIFKGERPLLNSSTVLSDELISWIEKKEANFLYGIAQKNEISKLEFFAENSSIGLNYQLGASGETVLTRVVKAGRYSTVLKLLELGADPLIADFLGNLPSFFTANSKILCALKEAIKSKK